MNFTFMIDNCLSSCQVTYNGLTLLDYAKNATEFFVKKRIKIQDTKYDTYHLFSSNSALSTWVHDIGHFLQTVKTIQPTLNNCLILEECFQNINQYRSLNGTDNLYGGRDVLKIESSIIFLFTHRDYPINVSKFPIRWDQKLVVFFLQPPGLEEMDSVIFETQWHQIASQIGCGQCYNILNYQDLFRCVDELPIIPQVSLRLKTLDYKQFEFLKYEGIERIKAEEFPQQNWLVRSPQKFNYQFASIRLRSNINMTIFTKVYLPEQYPILDFQNYPSYPEYYIDFRQNYTEKVVTSYQEMILDNPQLLNYVQQIHQQSKRKLSQFPIIHLDRRQNQTIPLLVGLLQYQAQQQLEIKFYLPNFHILNDIFLSLQMNQNRQSNTVQNFLNYLTQIPNYYSPCIKKLLYDNGIQIHRGFEYVYDDNTQQLYNMKIKQFQTIKQKQKKHIDEQNQKNRTSHVQKKSQCCAAYSDNYEFVFAEQLNSDYRQLTYQQNDKYHFKMLYPQLPCQSCMPQMPHSYWPPLKNAKVDSDEIEIRLEAAFCGNPWKLYRKSYKEGVEIKTEADEEYVEDMLLTKVDNIKQNTKNRRKGFMRLRDITENNHKQQEIQIEEPQTTEVEDGKVQIKEEKTQQFYRVKYQTQFQAKFKCQVMDKLNINTFN